MVEKQRGKTEGRKLGKADYFPALGKGAERRGQRERRAETLAGEAAPTGSSFKVAGACAESQHTRPKRQEHQDTCDNGCRFGDRCDPDVVQEGTGVPTIYVHERKRGRGASRGHHS